LLSLAPFLLLFFNFFSSSLVGAEDMGSTEELFLGMVTKLIGFLKREKRELTCIRDSLEVLFDQEDNSEAVGRHISAIQSASTHRDALNYISKHIHDKETRANFRELFFSSDFFFLSSREQNKQPTTGNLVQEALWYDSNPEYAVFGMPTCVDQIWERMEASLQVYLKKDRFLKGLPQPSHPPPPLSPLSSPPPTKGD